MKRFFSGVSLMCAMLLTAADPYFQTAIKEVDMGGEMLTYKNLDAATAFIQNEVPSIIIRTIASSGKNQLTPQFQTALQERLNFIFDLLDLSSFQAVAASSVKLSPTLFVAKNALVISPRSQSILLNRNVKNIPLDYMTLPADTRLAVCAGIDLGATWQQIKAAAAKSADPETRAILTSAENLKQQGFDLDAIFASLNGKFSLLLAGNDALSMRFKVEIPDKNGALSQLLKNFMPPVAGSNQASLPVPMPSGVPPVMIYARNSVVLASDASVMAKPAQTIAQLPKFREFARHLPQNGCAYMICNIPQGATETVNMLLSLNPDLPEFDLQPFAFAAVGRATSSGRADVIVSDFSLAQIDTAYLKTLIPMLYKIQTKALSNAQRR